MCDTDYTHTHHGHDSDISPAGTFFLGLVVLIKAAWWLLSRVVAPLVVLLAIVSWRWSSGAIMLPDRPRRRPLFTRSVRAAGRDLLTLALAGAILAPTATAIITVTLITAGITTVTTIRVRAARRRGPRRVKTVTGTPVRGPRIRHDPAQPALTKRRSDLTWTEQSVHDAAGRVA